MPSPTEQLEKLLRNPAITPNFKQLAMALVKQGADSTVLTSSGRYSTLLDVLLRTNKAGVNNSDIMELIALNPAVLACEDKFTRTLLQSLMDAFHYKEHSFEDFKQSAMILARNKADITCFSTTGEHPTLLHILIRNNKNGVNDNEIVELVRLNPAVLKSKNYYNYTVLQFLMEELHFGRCSLIDFKHSLMVLAKLGLDLSQNEIGGVANSVLHVLVHDLDENMGVIDELITLNNELVTIKNSFGCTPVHEILAANPNLAVSVFDRLLSTTNLNLRNNKGATLLHAACGAGNLLAVKHLYSKGMSLTDLTREDETLIHRAVLSSNKDLVQWLINTKKIDIDAKNVFGATALSLAKRDNKHEIIELLNHHATDSSIQNNDGQKIPSIPDTMENIQNDEGNDGTNELKFPLDQDIKGLDPVLSDSKRALFQTIEAMFLYGQSLLQQDELKGRGAVDLAYRLATKVVKFFNQKPEQRNFAEFKTKFLVLLHSRDEDMSTYRTSWASIIGNIALALTGFGLLVIAGQLIHSKITEGRALFFFQKSKTTREEKLADIEQSVNQMVLT